MTPIGKAKVHMKKMGKVEKTDLISSSFPSLEMRVEHPVSLLSNLCIMGEKSSILR